MLHAETFFFGYETYILYYYKICNKLYNKCKEDLLLFLKVPTFAATFQRKATKTL